MIVLVGDRRERRPKGGEALRLVSREGMNATPQHPDDFAGAFDSALVRLRIRIDTACAAEPGWPAQVAAAIRAALDFAAAHPDDARALTSDALAAGRAGFARYDRMLDHFAVPLHPGRDELPHGHDLPAIIDKALVGGVASLIASRLDTEPALLLALAPEAIQFVLTPYLGADSAREVSQSHRSSDGSAD